MDYEAWNKRLEYTRPWLVIEEDKVLGFGELDNNGHIDCFYVHKDYQHKGIGRFLLNWIEQVALRSGNLKLYADVSITAKPFFKTQGFRVIRPNLVVKGVLMLKNYVMEKDI
jgi:GNAT superfamily N-acetyltransferase